MRISGDKAAFYNTRLHGFQDTICDDKGRHFFKDCYVEGTIDFIFGSGKSLYLVTQLIRIINYTNIWFKYGQFSQSPIGPRIRLTLIKETYIDEWVCAEHRIACDTG